MKRKKIRRVLGRPRTGQQFYTSSYSLTLAEKQYLDKQANPSAYLRSLIDDDMAKKTLREKGLEKELKLLSLNRELEKLKKEEEAAEEDRLQFWRSIPHEGSFKHGLTWDGNVHDETGKYVPAVGADAKEKYLLNVLRAKKALAEKLQAKIEELQQKIADMDTT
jgi:hypothetical protein